MKPHQAVLICILIVFVLLTAALFLKVPSVWPDEAIYADVASNLLRENRLGTDLWQGMIPGVENHAYWYPPVFFYVVALWFKLFGLSIVNQRLLSIAVSFGFITSFYFLAKTFLKGKSVWFPVLALGALVIDFTFLRATRLSRPEIFILFLGTLSLFLFQKTFEENSNDRLRTWMIMGSGILASLAFLTHTIATIFFLSELFYLLATARLKTLRSKRFYLFVFSFLVPIVVWLISISPYLNVLREQLALAVERKNTEVTWIWLELQRQPSWLGIIYLSYVSVTVTFAVFSITYKKRQHLLLTTLILAWLLSTYGKMFWYSVLPVPFIYIALSVLLSETSYGRYREKEASESKWIFNLLLGILLITTLLNLKIQYTLVSNMGGNNYSYDVFVEDILEVIPEGKTVFLSCIPDPYFGFRTQGRNNKLFEFPVLTTPKEDYLEVLNASEFIVYTASYERIVFGDLLQEYIEKNELNTYPIGQPSQYQASVIELKPNNQRVNP